MSFEFCPKCEDGYLRRQHEGREVMVECQCLANEKFREAMVKANIYVAYHEHLFLNLPVPPHSDEQTKMREAIAGILFNNLRKWVEVGKGIYLYGGDRGTGKTTHLLILLKEALRIGYSVYNIHWMDFLGLMIRDRDEWNVLKNVDVLMIDEIGKDGARAETVFPKAGFDYIIRYRVSNRKPILMASNLEPREFSDNYGSGADSLLRSLTVLPVHGFDWREA